MIMKDKVKSRGVKKGETPKWRVGRKKGVSIKSEEKKKNVKFLGYKYTQKEAEELKKVFEEYKKRNNLNTTQALQKLILEKKEIT